MNIYKEREVFEAWIASPPYEKPLGINPEASGFPGQYRAYEVQLAWEAYQAGRAALQSQKPEPNNLMLSAVLRMPIEMAMADPISRMQFYQRAQQALDELEALQHSCKETSQDREDAERIDWMARQDLDDLSFSIIRDAPNDGEYTIHTASGSARGKTFRKAIDHARRVEKERT